jgi:hypothetical protein
LGAGDARALYPKNETKDPYMQNESGYDLKKAHEMLENASKLVDQSIRFIPRDHANFDRSKYVEKAGHVLSFINEMYGDIFDLAPELTPEFLRPSLKPHDMSINLEHLKSEEESFISNSIRAFSIHMPKNIFDKFMKEDSILGKFAIAEAWWNDQNKPFIPLHGVARFLNHERLYMRYHAAKEIERMYGIILWNDHKNKLDEKSVRKWLSSESINI